MLEVIPGILEKDWVEIERKICLVRPFAKAIHLDIIDGKFAQNSTFLDPLPFKKYTSEIFFEVHLMVEEPIQYLKPWAEVGFRRFLGQVEKMSDQVEFVAQGQLLGEVGLALDGPTSLEKLKVPIDDLDAILFMTIKAGFSGQVFNPQYLEKVKAIRDKSNIAIEVDGGINDQTIIQAKNAGANYFAATSFIYKSTDPRGQFNILKEKISA